ncbi:thioredoxin-like domain-containing protein [Spongiimicrobium salis]|uniref:thioredoxin-like domain-containing protein n=1 Tax=Spongiimicrobium salis TaxID=1667022 RepID=UPI00374D4E40
MKQFLFFLFAFVMLASQAQHSISGTLTPAEDYKWIIAYHLNAGTQNYVADGQVKNGKFSLKIKDKDPVGTYRVVYAVPQEEFYFDVIYSGQEDVTLTFDANTGLKFSASEENKVYADYAKDMAAIEQEIFNFYSAKKTDEATFVGLMDNVKKVQTFYEGKSANLMNHNFIKASVPYTPDHFQTVEEYIKNKTQHYFDAIDFGNPILQNSSFLLDRVVNYIFTALPLGKLSAAATEKTLLKNVQTVSQLVNKEDLKFQTNLYEVIWSDLSGNDYHNTADAVYQQFLKPLATKTGNANLISSIEVHNRLRIGAQAPEIEWKEASSTKRLSALGSSPQYLLVFWSSTCSHCLNELPKLHEALKGNSKLKVLAIGLEDNDRNWRKETAKLPGFTHAISLGKWESVYAQLYNIRRTPSYFILDQDKNIRAKPEDYEEVLGLLK